MKYNVTAIEDTDLIQLDARDNQRWLARALIAGLVANILASVFELAMGQFQITMLMIQSISVNILFFVTLLTAYSLTRANRLRAAIWLLLIMMLVSCIGAVVLIPATLAIMLCVLIAVSTLALPYLTRRATIGLLLIVWLAAISATTIARYTPGLLNVKQIGPEVEVFAIGQAITALLLMLWRAHARLLRLLHATHEANQALRGSQSNLETAVSERTAELAESAIRFRALSELTSDCAYTVTIAADGTIVTDWVSDSYERITGYTLDHLNQIGGLPAIIHPDDLPTVLERRQTLLTNQNDVSEFRILTVGGDVRLVRAHTMPVWNPAEARVSRVIGAMQDLTEQRRYQQQIEQLAFYDPLTGLVNRRRLHDRLTAALETADTERLAVLYIDLDRFKAVNDTLGHDVGDDLLIQVSARLSECVRSDDTLARLGGDEFAILLPDADEDQASRVAQRILERLDPAFDVNGHFLRMQGSIGVACYPRDGRQTVTLLQRADIAMYRAKSAGSQWSFFRPEFSPYAQEQLQLEAELRHAIKADELVLYFQPILDLERGIVIHAETLVRWNHPTRGLVAPGVFIPLAEECGLIRDLDRWVLRRGLQQLARWETEGLAIGVTVNLSARSLQEPNMAAFVAECLAETGAGAVRLTIEMTESAAMRDLQTTVNAMEQIRALGARIALDDFGSGYASLGYLKELPVDLLKVDRTFVNGIGRDRKDEGVLRACIALGRGLEIPVVAEGVETREQIEWLRTAGFRRAQGFAIGRPVPAQELEGCLWPLAMHATLVTV